jgi:hypothetical protein
MRNGALLQELHEALQAAADAAAATGKPARVTLAMTVKPASKGAEDQFLWSDKISTSLPMLERETLVFRDDDGNFTRRAPSQPEVVRDIKERTGTDA